MKKKFLILCLVMLSLLMLPATASNVTAAELQAQSPISQTITQLENGDSLIVELTIPVNSNNAISTCATTKTISGKKTVTYCNSKDKALWSFSISASFSYNGSSATCTSVSTNKQINDTAWKLSNITKSKSANVAKGSVTAKECFLGIPFNTVTENLQLKCSANGTLS